MKKILFIISLVIVGLPVLSQQTIQLQKNCEYIFFSDSKIQSIKSNNPAIISAQRVSTYTGEENQIVFYPKRVGVADIQIQTEKEVQNYKIEIKNGSVNENDIFVQLDVPGIIEK